MASAPWILLFMQLVCAHDTAPADELPKSSTDFFASYTCSNTEEIISLDNEADGSFFRWVLAARHTAWHSGWEVAMPHFNNSSNNVGMEDDKYYARVFDLLNWSMKHNLLPVPIDISSICHKGMETQYSNGISLSNVNPTEKWPSLDETCHKQLLSASRISSSCIDIPGIIVTNPNPPLKVNNPCHLEYRMVDGAHRICLRKHLLTLLNRELEELKESRAKTSTFDNVIHLQIQQKQKLITQTTHGLFLVMNQTTFQSMLMSTDPHTSWAKNKQYLMKDVTKELQLEWKQWMGQVMDRVWESKNEYCGEEISVFSNNDAKPKEEL